MDFLFDEETPKSDSNTGVFREICKITDYTFFYRAPLVPASDIW